MEYLDIYDEDGNFLGKEDRAIVHRDALWHKTVHAWLYNKLGEVYFQIRKDEGTLYTTASGHLQAGERVKEAFGREIKEELGLDVNYEEAEVIDVIKYVCDKEKADGAIFKDRAFANIYRYDFEGNASDFAFDTDEVLGVALVNAKEALELFTKEKGKIKATIIKDSDGENIVTEEILDFKDFLVNKGETALEKYGFILDAIIKATE